MKIIDTSCECSLMQFQSELSKEVKKISPIPYQELNREEIQSLQREGAKALEALILSFTQSGGVTGDKDLALVLVRLLDLQVRDYALGLVGEVNREIMINFWRGLVAVSPCGFLSAPATLLAEILYEDGALVLAMRALEAALRDDPDYQLAKLLRRAFNAGWSVESFQAMRMELHPKVKEAIFGKRSEE